MKMRGTSKQTHKGQGILYNSRRTVNKKARFCSVTPRQCSRNLGRIGRDASYRRENVIFPEIRSQYLDSIKSRKTEIDINSEEVRQEY